MKKTLFLLPLFLLMNCEEASPAREEIVRALKAQQDAWNKGSVESFMSFYHDNADLTFAGSNGITKGYQNVLNRYLANYNSPEKMGVLSFEILEFKALGDNAALVIGSWSLAREADNPGGYFTLIWQNIDGEWKIVHDHTS